MRGLVVDDSSVMRKVLTGALSRVSIKEVDEASDGQEAVNLVADGNEYDVILMDWNMPNMTGMELLEALRAENIDVTFGFITTESSKEMRQKATDAGAKFLISKPFTLESFEKVLSTIMN